MTNEQKIKIELLDAAAKRISNNLNGFICHAINDAYIDAPFDRSPDYWIARGKLKYYISTRCGVNSLEWWLLDRRHISREQYRRYTGSRYGHDRCHRDMKVYRLRWIEEMKRLVRAGEL